MNLRESLHEVDIFDDLPDEVLEDLVSHGSTRRAAAGQLLAEQGHAEAGLQVVLEGRAIVKVNGVDVGAMRPGQYFGEMSLIDGKPRSATVVSGPEGVQTFAISPISFSSLMDKHPEIARCLLKVLVARIRRIEEGLG